MTSTSMITFSYAFSYSVNVASNVCVQHVSVCGIDTTRHSRACDYIH